MEQQALTDDARSRRRVPLGELQDGQRVGGVYAVRERELRRKRNGEPWLRLTLGDASGSCEAVCLGGRRGALRARGPRDPGLRQRPLRGQRALGLEDQAERAARGRRRRVQRRGPRRRVGGLLRAARERPARAAGDRPGPAAARLLDRFFGEDSEIWARFRDAPAAKVYHQAYRHGLLEHTVSVAQAVSAAAAFFPGIDRDVAVTGALLHDIGKTEAYNDDPLAIDLTDAGRLQGEIPLGYYKVRRQIEEIPGFDPALAQAVLHIILAHHGSLEHGSPVVPATREAVLVHMIDNLGGRLGSFDRLERQLPAGESWSGFDRALSGSAYFGQRAALRSAAYSVGSAHVAVGVLDAVDQLLRVPRCAWSPRTSGGSAAGPGVDVLDRLADLVQTGRVDRFVGRLQDRLDDEEVGRGRALRPQPQAG